jgi:predicted RNase H-like HicB family nuclease
MIKKKSKTYSANQVKEKVAEYSTRFANNYAAIIEQDEDGFFVASVPALPGCHTQAKTLPELRKRVKDAIKLCLSVAKKDLQYRNQIKLMAYQPRFVSMETVTV